MKSKNEIRVEVLTARVERGRASEGERMELFRVMRALDRDGKKRRDHERDVRRREKWGRC